MLDICKCDSPNCPRWYECYRGDFMTKELIRRGETIYTASALWEVCKDNRWEAFYPKDEEVLNKY